ncbi:MAG: oligosaccharide flippase family protein [Sulfuritalea sp.]|nr:oligosaccharide flippase family protein [Sulfuritalea sp.]
MLGSGWAAFLSLAFVPLYIHFLGLESYGLIGFYVTLQVLFSVLDMGLTTTLSREMARLSAAGNAAAQDMRNVVRTLEVVYWVLAVFIITAVVLTADWIATSWLNSNRLPPDVLGSSITLMGVVIAFRMPYGFYAGGLIGLQRQVLLNGMKSAIETFRNGGGVIVIWLVSPTITAFFTWHAIAGVIAAILSRMVLWRSLPRANGRASFTPSLFRQLWSFGAGMSAISLLALLLVELDKIILSKMLPLDELGYYMLASTVAMGINLIIVPLVLAIQPRLTQLVAGGDVTGLRQIYHMGCQLMTVLVMPFALGLCFFSEPLLRIWTQNADIARFSAPVLSLLALGTAMNAMMNIPYALQLAHGWTRLALITTSISVLVLVPALIVMIDKFGVIGAASIWVVLNAGNVLLTLPIVHAKFLRGEYKHWLLVDFLRPTCVVLAVLGLGRFFMPEETSMTGEAVWIALWVTASLFVGAKVTPVTRSYISRKTAG